MGGACTSGPLVRSDRKLAAWRDEDAASPSLGRVTVAESETKAIKAMVSASISDNIIKNYYFTQSHNVQYSTSGFSSNINAFQ